MTLSRFLRDYLYIPLGGNRKGRVRTYVNLLITMLLGGLWHGASWTFVAWGGLHGVALAINHVWRAGKPKALISVVPRFLREGTAFALTFLFVVFAWVFFRAANFETVLRLLNGMIGMNGFGPIPSHPFSEFEQTLLLVFRIKVDNMWMVTTAFYTTSLFIIFFLPNSQELLEPARFRDGHDRTIFALPLRWKPSIPWALVCSSLVILSLMTFTRVSEFLYFQF
jgi:alginate O-acetyltransferase complex protein AlgI